MGKHVRKAGSAAGKPRPRGRAGSAAADGKLPVANDSMDNPPKSPIAMDDAEENRDELDEGASFPIVGIGASAGGLEAFTQLLKALPLDTGMGFVLVQHLDPDHESALTQILTRVTSLPVQEVTNNQAVQANHVYIIPPDTNLSIVQGVLKLEPRPKVRTPHRPIDTFFESLSQDLRERAIGVVLSGTASDGTLGLEAIKAEGGITFAQDDSAKYDSMPRSAVGAGCVDLVLSPADIAKELGRIARHPYVGSAEWRVGSDEREQTGGDTSAEDDRAEATEHGEVDSPLPSGGSGAPSTGAKQVRAEARSGAKEASTDSPLATRHSPLLDGYRKIVLLLRSHSGVDFSLYKSNTIQRRITRRLVLNNLETLEEYAEFLRGNAKELNALYSDVLISVTSFFRNPEMFDVLQREVFPKLLKQPGDQPIRVWVLGCSTGQEAYSIAMAYLESAEKFSRLRKLQVFATDLNDTLLDKARNGLYARSLANDITPERLRRFFIEEQGGYRVCKMLREMVVFARQNLIADTPFSRMDLVSCRNLLIYLEPSLQKKAMPTFHFALKPGGFLLLGASESIGGFTDLFEPVDKKYKIYSKKPAQPHGIQLPVRGERDAYGAPSERPPHPPRMSEPPEGLRGEHNVQSEADRITMRQFAPPGIIISTDLQVLQFRGRTGAYLEPPIGKASLDVFKMAREGLMLPLRSAINEAMRENKPVRRENVYIKQDGKTHTITLEVIPLKNLSEPGFLILFVDAEKAGRAALATQAGQSASAPGLIDDAAETRVLGPSAHQKSATHDEVANRIAELETELSETREYLQSIQEEYEAANEELQSASEEVQSSNEELQSINEELETSKEEMESANEELTTVNEEMSNRNVELDRVNNDLVNLQTSAKLAIVLLGRDLTIRRFSPQAEKQFDLLAADMGRPISHIRHRLVFSDAGKTPVDLEVLAATVIADVREQEREVRDNADRWHLLRVRPYMTLDNKVDGAVMVLVEIEALKLSEQIAIIARNYAENILETVREPMLVLDHDLRVESVNRSFYRTFRVTPAETVGSFIYDLGNRQWNIPRLRKLLQEILSLNQSVEDFEVEHHFEQLGRRVMLLNARRIIDPLQNSERILLAIEDITERKQAEETLRASTERLKVATDAAALGIHTYEVKTGRIEWDERVRALWGVSQDVPINYDTFLSGLHPDDKVATHAAVDEALDPKGDGQYAAEYRVKNFTDGIVRWVAATGRVFFEGNEAVRLVGTVQDISKRKKAEEALRESERDYRALADASLEIPYRMSADWSTMLAMDGRQLFASSECPIADWAWMDLYLPRDEHARVQQTISEAIAQKKLFEMEHRVLRLDGSTGWVRSRSVPLLDENREVTAWFGAASDITARKRSEERLRESEERLQKAISVKNVGVLFFKLDGHMLDANGALERMSGYTAEELRGITDWAQLTPPEFMDVTRRAAAELAESGVTAPYEKQWIRKDGSRFWGRFSPTRLSGSGSESECVEFTIDITETKRAEELLRLHRQSLETMVNHLPAAVALIRGSDLTFQMVNPGYQAFAPGKQMTGKTIAEVWPEHMPLFGQRCGHVLETGEPIQEVDERFEIRRDCEGPLETTYFTWSIRRVNLLDEVQPGLLITCWETTASKEVELALEEQRRLYQSVTDNASVALFIMDEQQQCRFMNPAAERLTGYTQAETFGRPLHDVVHHTRPDGSPYPLCECPIDQAFPKNDREQGEEVFVHKDGHFYRVTFTASPLRDTAGQPVGTILEVQDITDRKRAETALMISEIRYRRLFESAKDGILILDAHADTIIDANPFMVEMLGYSQEELVGKELWQIGLFKDVEASKVAMRELQEKGYLRYEDLPLKTKAGRGINVEFVSNVYGEDGETVSQCNIRDITERRDTEQALKKALVYADDIIATLREPFVVLNVDLRVRTANRSFYDTFHVSKGETENQLVYDLGNGQWAIPVLRTLLDQVLSRNESVHDFEVEHTFPTLGRKTMLLNARPFPPDSKHPELILLAVEDVSAVRERADELADVNRRKDEFLATLAHELRNPLAPIRNGLQIMKMAGVKPDVVEKSREMMERQVGQMTHLIDDLMDVSRINQGKIVLQKARLRLADVIQDAVDTSRPLIEERGHDLVVDLPTEPLYVDADRTRLAQVFGNLLNNAAKYTDMRGRIRLAVERQGSGAVVSVADNGVGIPADMLARVFDMFAQIDRSLEKSQGGLGIGLNIVKRLVEMHDGSIVAESGGHGAGSRFVVRLPIALSLNAEQRDKSVESVVETVTVTAGRRILVVDDNRDAAISLALVLEVMGYELQTAHDGLEALDLAAKFRPDLVLLDIGMPRLNGYDTARRIREQTWGKSMVLVALTGWGQDEDKRNSQEAGFDAHLVKPVDPDALEKILATCRVNTA